MVSFMNSLTETFANGSWSVLLSVFAMGILGSLNPCMAAMLPLIVGGTAQKGYGKVVQFIAGFTLTLVFLGLLAALVGKALNIPGWLWAILLGVVYLVAGLLLLRLPLPIRISGFYVNKGNRLRLFANREGLNPSLLGVIFGLSPSPCTLPFITVVSAITIAKGKILFGVLSLLAFGLGHSLILALTFLPRFRHILRGRLLHTIRPALGVVLILLAAYFLIWQPDLSQYAHMPEHQH